IVTANGKPVADAEVMAQGHFFQVTGVTGKDGVALLKLPADDRLNDVSAWYKELGVAGAWQLDKKPQQASTTLALHEPAPLTVPLLNPEGVPVSDVEFCVGNAVLKDGEEYEVILTHEFAASRVRTNERGEASVPWAPRDKLSYINIDFLDGEWK